jgi:hypothetical protein
VLNGIEAALLFGRVFHFVVFEGILQAGKGGDGPGKGGDVDFVDPSASAVSA